MRRSQSADQPQQERPSSSSSCHGSLPLPPHPAPGTRSPSRRKLPAIPAGAANAKFPSVIRITRAQLQQVMSPSLSRKKKLHSASSTRKLSTFSFFLSFFFFFCLSCLFLASLFSRLAFCVVVRQLSPETMRGIVQARQSMGQMCPCVWTCVLVIWIGVCVCLIVACVFGMSSHDYRLHGLFCFRSSLSSLSFSFSLSPCICSSPSLRWSPLRSCVNVSCPTCWFSTHSLTDTAIALCVFRSDNGSYGTACCCQTNHHLLPHIIQFFSFSHICIRLLLQNYSTTQHVVVYQQQAFDF